VVWIIFSPLRFQAQVAGASLSGTVSDASGAALAGAKIKIEVISYGAMPRAGPRKPLLIF